VSIVGHRHRDGELLTTRVTTRELAKKYEEMFKSMQDRAREVEEELELKKEDPIYADFMKELEEI
jgi:hypothetical protein